MTRLSHPYLFINYIFNVKFNLNIVPNIEDERNSQHTSFVSNTTSKLKLQVKY